MVFDTILNWNIFAILLLCCDFVRCLDNSRLDSVIVLFRHGDRTPQEPYPNDPYKNRSYWPVGFGQLTNEGKQRQYELGQWLRQQYDDFLSKEYFEDDIYILSTDKDRTLMSASANLAGLYPPTKNQIWNKNIPWQPIPIHTNSINDNVLLFTKPCPRHTCLLKELFQTEQYQKLQTENKELYNYLSIHTGTNISTFSDVIPIFDTLNIEQKFNFTLPVWTEKIKIGYLESLWALYSMSEVYDTPLARLATGPFFDQMLNHFNMFISNNFSRNVDNIYWKQKFVMLSGHDSTIARILDALGVYQDRLPPYASAIIFELRRTEKGDSFVKLLFKKDTEATPIKLEGCGNIDCDYNVFESSLQDVVMSPEEWKRECNS